MTYDEVYKDHSFLFGIGPADDMTGGYVDSHDLDSLLKKNQVSITLPRY